MKLTPLEIQKKTFNKSFRGYNEAEVTDYLDKISRNYEELYSENQELKERVISLTKRLNDYKNMENTLKDAILLAQKTAENVKNNAKREKQFIIKQAVEKSAKIIDKAERTLDSIKNQNDELKRQFSLYKTRFINFLESQYDLVNSYQLDMDDIPEDYSKVFSEIAVSVDEEDEETEIKDENDIELEKNQGIRNIELEKNQGIRNIELEKNQGIRNIELEKNQGIRSIELEKNQGVKNEEKMAIYRNNTVILNNDENQ